MQLVGSNPNYAQTVPFEMMLELSSVPHKRQIIDKLKKAREEAQQGQAQAQAQQQAIAQAGAEADIEKTKAEAQNKRADTAEKMVGLAAIHMQPGMDPGMQDMPQAQPPAAQPPPGF
jgi:hypothetical protein